MTYEHEKYLNSIERTQLDIARDIAFEAHALQTRRDGLTPYITHPLQVSSGVRNNPSIDPSIVEKCMCVSWLHDVIEDSKETTKTLISKGVDYDVVVCVDAITKRSNEPYLSYLIRVKQNHIATLVKISDMENNLKDSPTEKQKIRYADAIEFLKH